MSSNTYPLGPVYPYPNYPPPQPIQPWPQPQPYSPNVTTTLIWKEPKVSDFEIKQLEEIVDALKKARAAFGGLVDDEDKGRGNRAAAYLSARFGVKETTVIDMLMEEE